MHFLLVIFSNRLLIIYLVEFEAEKDEAEKAGGRNCCDWGVLQEERVLEWSMVGRIDSVVAVMVLVAAHPTVENYCNMVS